MSGVLPVRGRGATRAIAGREERVPSATLSCVGPINVQWKCQMQMQMQSARIGSEQQEEEEEGQDLNRSYACRLLRRT